MVNSIENMDTFTFIEGEVSWMEQVSIRLVEDLSEKKKLLNTINELWAIRLLRKGSGSGQWSS